MKYKYGFKYKGYDKIFHFKKSFPTLKLLKFKHGKWLKNRKHLLQDSKKKTKKRFFKNFLIVPIFKRWLKGNKIYKDSLFLKRSFNRLFNYRFSVPYLKKNLYCKNAIRAFLIKPIFKIEILLWKLKIYKSVREAQKNIIKNIISINNKTKFKSFYYLKKGDIIDFSCVNLGFIKRSFIQNQELFFPFCEIDFYSGTIIIVKDLNELTEQDLLLMLNQHVDIQPFVQYLKRNKK